MTDRYENIRQALAMGATPGSWVQDIDGDAAYAMFCCQTAAEAAFVVACDPDTIRELLAERDQLADALTAQAQEIERLREIAKGVDDGGHWYSQQTMDAVVRERDELREKVERLRALVSNDAYAGTFQSMGQYRAALMRAIEGAKP